MKSESRELKMLETLAEVTGESLNDLKEAHETETILLYENAHDLLWFMHTEQPNGVVKIINLDDWGWSLDLRKLY